MLEFELTIVDRSHVRSTCEPPGVVSSNGPAMHYRTRVNHENVLDAPHGDGAVLPFSHPYTTGSFARSLNLRSIMRVDRERHVTQACGVDRGRRQGFGKRHKHFRREKRADLCLLRGYLGFLAQAGGEERKTELGV